MDDLRITISVSDEDKQFIAEQIAAGNFADESEMVHAGLTALGREAKVRELRRLIAEGDADIAAGRVYAFDTPEDMMRAAIGRAKSRS
jgi:antitoxin ParD1/3/4